MNYGERQLQSLIKSKEYERLPEDTKNKLIEDKKLDIKETITDPIIIPNPNNIDVYKEKVLHNLIYENLDNFLKKLGSDYYYVGREYKIKIGDTYHRIDFLLFNMEYDAYIVNLTWKYKEDMVYQSSAKITVIKDDKFLYIVKSE